MKTHRSWNHFRTVLPGFERSRRAIPASAEEFICIASSQRWGDLMKAISLLCAAQDRNDALRAYASLFVNPKQFGAQQDFAK